MFKTSGRVPRRPGLLVESGGGGHVELGADQVVEARGEECPGDVGEGLQQLVLAPPGIEGALPGRLRDMAPTRKRLNGEAHQSVQRRVEAGPALGQLDGLVLGQSCDTAETLGGLTES